MHLTRRAITADVGMVIEAFGKNEHVKKVFRALFAALAGIVLTQVLDPGAAKRIVGVIMGMCG
jgi:hypothetical protein